MGCSLRVGRGQIVRLTDFFFPYFDIVAAWGISVSQTHLVCSLHLHSCLYFQWLSTPKPAYIHVCIFNGSVPKACLYSCLYFQWLSTQSLPIFMFIFSVAQYPKPAYIHVCIFSGTVPTYIHVCIFSGSVPIACLNSCLYFQWLSTHSLPIFMFVFSVAQCP